MYQYDSRNRCIAKKFPGCDWRPVVLGASYYDDYSFTGYSGIPTLTNSSVGYEPDALYDKQ
nr:hypothetical protein [Bacteroides acidifaciens]